MAEMSRRDLAVTGGVALVIIAAVEVGLLGPGHILGLLFAYVAVSVGSVAFGRGTEPPSDARKAALGIATFIAAAGPLAIAVAPSADAEFSVLRSILLVCGWALPISLTVAFGAFDAERQRRYVVAGHLLALVVLLASANVAFRATRVAELPGGPLIAALLYYVVGVVVGYPAVLSYRRGLESA